jgi:HNH endonuclease
MALSHRAKREIWPLVFEKTDGRCYYCGKRSTTKKMGQPPLFMTIDHVVATVRDGTDDLENLVPCCRGCNSAKCAGSIETLRHTAAQRASGMPNFTREQIEWIRRRGHKLLTSYDNFRFWFEKEAERQLWHPLLPPSERSARLAEPEPNPSTSA